MLTCSLEGTCTHDVGVCAADRQQTVASGEPACTLLSLGFLQAASACKKLSSGIGEVPCLLLCLGLQPATAAEPFAPLSCQPFGGILPAHM